MSAENVANAKRAIEGYNRLDVDAFVDHATADFEWIPAMPGLVEGHSYVGRRGVEEYFREIRDTWEELCIVDAEYRDLGDRILVLGRVEGSGRGSGIYVRSPLAVIIELRGDRAWRSRSYLDHDEALRAAGLAE